MMKTRMGSAKRRVAAGIGVCALALSMAACGGSGSGAGSGGGSETKTYKLTGSSFAGPTSVQISVLLDDWAKALEASTEGQVQSEITYGGALFTGPEGLESVSKGVADFSSTTPGYNPGELPLSVFLVTQEIGAGVDETGGMLITLKLWEEFPEFEAEWEKQGVKPVTFMIFDPYYFISPKAVTDLASLNGLRTQAVGEFSPRLVASIGMTGVNMPTAETYTGLSTGTIDATFTCGDCQVAAKTYEVASHSLRVGPVLSMAPVVGFMSLNTFNSLPKDVQEEIEKLKYSTSMIGVPKMEARSAEVASILGKETKLSELSESELAQWKSVAPDFRAEWAEKMDGMGLPGTKINERYKELVQEYKDGTLKPWWDGS